MPSGKKDPKVIELYSKQDFSRLVEEPDREILTTENYRSPFRRDYARLIHSPAFRRLQGKTQLFPGLESDFFRNRLTHSMEVAQIAKSIAIRLNSLLLEEGWAPIDLDLVELAALAHDLGHPPFGHNGERALDDCMKLYGRFEGNAQTLRILSTLEKKRIQENPEAMPISSAGKDFRVGLNLTFRALGAVLKYDDQLPNPRKKGYYSSDAGLVTQIKRNVVGPRYRGAFKSVECQIMDIADDIAYSTYDIEDAFKAGFLTPLDMIASADGIFESVCRKVHNYTRKLGGRTYEALNEGARTKVQAELLRDLIGIFEFSRIFSSEISSETLMSLFTDSSLSLPVSLISGQTHRMSEKLRTEGYMRTDFTSQLVGRFVRGVSIEPNQKRPALSRVIVDSQVRREIEILKHFAYESQVNSPRLKVAEYRGIEIVKDIFKVLDDTSGEMLPLDFREIYMRVKKKSEKKRVICDFVAGMTDRYALEFYGRLHSENSESIFKPL